MAQSAQELYLKERRESKKSGRLKRRSTKVLAAQSSLARNDASTGFNMWCFTLSNGLWAHILTNILADLKNQQGLSTSGRENAFYAH
jgi:hypothetical protein